MLLIYLHFLFREKYPSLFSDFVSQMNAIVPNKVR